MNRQYQLLAGLVVVLAASLLYAFWAMPRLEKAPPKMTLGKPVASAKVKGGSPAAAGKESRPAKASTDRLLLELLNPESLKFHGAGRDIFRLPGRPLPVVAEVKPEDVVPPPPPPPQPPPTPEEILRGAVKEVTFLGFLEKGGGRTVFLSSGGDVYLIRGGEHFGKNKELIVKEINPKQMVVGWVDGPETVKVQLLENEKLQPTMIGGGRLGKEKTPASAGAPPVFPGAGGNAPRRMLIPPRTASAPPAEGDAPPEEPVAETPDQPKQNVNLEELLKKGLPRGE